MRKVCFIHLLETYKTHGNYMLFLQIPNVKTISIQSVTDWIEIRLNDCQSYFVLFLFVFVVLLLHPLIDVRKLVRFGLC